MTRAEMVIGCIDLMEGVVERSPRFAAEIVAIAPRTSCTPRVAMGLYQTSKSRAARRELIRGLRRAAKVLDGLLPDHPPTL